MLNTIPATTLPRPLALTTVVFEAVQEEGHAAGARQQRNPILRMER